MVLADFANLAQVVGAVVVVAGVVFAIVQVKEAGRLRREAASLQLASSFANPEFAHAWREVLSLPPGADAAEVKRLGVEDSAMLMSLTIESVGIMVHRQIVELDMVWELMGGVVLAFWDRTQDWARLYRQTTGREKFNEWCQWLAEQLAERYTGDAAAPAYKRFMGWRRPAA